MALHLDINIIAGMKGNYDLSIPETFGTGGIAAIKKSWYRWSRASERNKKAKNRIEVAISVKTRYMRGAAYKVVVPLEQAYSGASSVEVRDASYLHMKRMYDVSRNNHHEYKSKMSAGDARKHRCVRSDSPFVTLIWVA